MAMTMTEREMLVKTLQDAEADLRRKITNVELRQVDVDRAEAAYADAVEKQAVVQNTCDWLRERLRELPEARLRALPDEPAQEAATAPPSEPASNPAAQLAPAPVGTLFGRPMPEVTNTGLCIRALEQIGQAATTKEVREKIRELGHELNQGQVRGSLKYLAGRRNSPVENPEPGIWLLRRAS
jgi:hypothetical protein